MADNFVAVTHRLRGIAATIKDGALGGDQFGRLRHREFRLASGLIQHRPPLATSVSLIIR
jgi:hypothetical protein